VSENIAQEKFIVHELAIQKRVGQPVLSNGNLVFQRKIVMLNSGFSNTISR
jgi:hypothetical protein